VKLRPIIGIDISANEVRAALVRPQGGSLQLTAVATTELPDGSLQADGLPNPTIVGEAIKRACQQLDPKVTQVVIGLSHCSLVARVMEIPPVPDSDIRAVLRGEMDHFRILPEGQSAFDCYRLPELQEGESTQNEEPVMRALLMGAEERIVAGYRAAVDAAGLTTLAVEPGAIASLRALYPALKAEPSVATVFLSASGTDIFITHEGGLRFYRRVETGTGDLRNAKPTTENSPAAHGPLVAPDEQDVYLYQPQAPAYDPYNRQAMALLMTEVQRSLDFYLREYPQGSDTMRLRFVTDAQDGAALIDALSPYLRGEADLASVAGVVPALPVLEQMLSGPDGSRCAAAIGLAFRGAQGDFAGAPALDLSVGDMVVVERRIAPRMMWATAAFCGVIFLGTITTAIFLSTAVSRADQQLSQSKAELRALTNEHEAIVAGLERQKNLVATIRERDKPVKEVIEFMAASVSRRACLRTLVLEYNGVVFLSGEATSPRVVADMMDTINLSPMLEPVRMNALQRLNENTGGNGLKFDLETAIRKTPFVPPAVTQTAELSTPLQPGAPAAKQGGGT
jgi:type IV pilus assembly protein PilM